MKEEDILRKKLSTKENPFKVPENYFENVNSQKMDQRPEKPARVETKKTTTWQKFKPFLYMAAMFVGAALIIKVASYEMDKNELARQMEGYELSEADDQYFNEVVNGTMLDDYSLYVYLTSSDNE